MVVVYEEVANQGVVLQDTLPALKNLVVSIVMREAGPADHPMAGAIHPQGHRPMAAHHGLLGVPSGARASRL